MSAVEVLVPDKAAKSDSTARKPWQFQPGNRANPHGRPKGSRNKLGETVLADLLDDWREGGREAIRRVREEDPSTYLRVVGSVIPKELILHTSVLDELEREEIADFVRRLEEVKRLAESNPEIARLMIEALPAKTG